MAINGVAVNILNDDPVGLPQVSIGDRAVLERAVGVNNASFVLNLNKVSTQAVTVTYNTGNLTATAGTDYNAISGIITFSPGQTTTTINVGVLGDQVYEPNETFAVNLISATNAGIADNQGIGTITNDDPLPRINILNSFVVEGDSGITNANFVVSLDRLSALPTTVKFSTANSTALAGSDYNATSGTLTFSAGQTLATISVGVRGDLITEPQETFALNLTTPTNASLARTQAIGTINNEDVSPLISISNTTVTEGNSGVKNAVFGVTLTRPSSLPITVNYGTLNGSALAGSDYNAGSGTLTFSPGQTSKTLSVGVIGDTLREVNETFQVILNTATNSFISKSHGIGTIVNDDPLPQLRISDSNVVERNAGITLANFTVSLNTVTTQFVSVPFATTNGTAIAGVDYQPGSGVINFVPGQTTQTIQVIVLSDTIPEATETFLLNLGTPTNATVSDGQGVGSIIDNDTPVGKNQSDRLIGQVKTLIGTAAADVFPLDGNYASHGNADYGLIVGFESGKDTIQLQGDASDYYLGASRVDSQSVGIFLKSQQDLVGVIKDVNNLNLNSDSFSFV